MNGSSEVASIRTPKIVMSLRIIVLAGETVSLCVIDYLFKPILHLGQLLVLQVHIVPLVLRVEVVRVDHVSARLRCLLEVAIDLIVIRFQEVLKIEIYRLLPMRKWRDTFTNGAFATHRLSLLGLLLVFADASQRF